MKNSLESINSRRDKILELLHQHEALTIDELSEQTQVSAMTIRRDCKQLVAMGEVEQKRGVISIVHRNVKTNLSDPHDKIKEALAKAAADHVKDSHFISINSSTTALKVLKYLHDPRTIVQTNNANVVNFPNADLYSIILCGGELTPEHILVGQAATNSFSNVQADLAIIGCAGLNINDGITTPIFHEADVNRAIIKHCQRLIVVADYSKIGNTSNFKIGEIDDIDILITDTFAPDEELNKIRRHGVEVVQIPM